MTECVRERGGRGGGEGQVPGQSKSKWVRAGQTV